MIDKKDLDIFAKTIYGEARGESLVGKKAVASVIMNRFQAKKWFSGDTVAETCQFKVGGSKYHQFSCWNEFDVNSDILKDVNETSASFLECKYVASQYLTGVWGDIVGGACHYHVNGLDAMWSRGKEPDFVVGNHSFYIGID